MQDRIEIEPATIDMVRATSTGALVQIDNDVQNVAADLREINPALKLEFDREQEYFVVKQEVLNERGELEEKLVTTSRTCDQRLVRRVREISAPGYNLADELDRLDDQAERDADHAMTERMGPLHEQLSHAIRKDLGASRIFVPDTSATKAA